MKKKIKNIKPIETNFTVKRAEMLSVCSLIGRELLKHQPILKGRMPKDMTLHSQLGIKAGCYGLYSWTISGFGQVYLGTRSIPLHERYPGYDFLDLSPDYPHVPARATRTAHSPGRTPFISPARLADRHTATGLPVAFITSVAHSACSAYLNNWEIKWRNIQILSWPWIQHHLCKRGQAFMFFDWFMA